ADHLGPHDADQSCVLQDLQVVADGALRLAQRVGQLRRRRRAFEEEIDDLQTSLVEQGTVLSRGGELELGGEFIVGSTRLVGHSRRVGESRPYVKPSRCERPLACGWASRWTTRSRSSAPGAR